jgi:hypothetical protein
MYEGYAQTLFASGELVRQGIARQPGSAITDEAGSKIGATGTSNQDP